MEEAELVRFLQAEIENYAVPEPHPEALGGPLPHDWYAKGIERLQSALVVPYRVQARDEDLWLKDRNGTFREVVIVAEENGLPVMAYDPRPDGDFVLVGVAPDGTVGIWNIRSDAVDCFLSI